MPPATLKTRHIVVIVIHILRLLLSTSVLVVSGSVVFIGVIYFNENRLDIDVAWVQLIILGLTLLFLFLEEGLQVGVIIFQRSSVTWDLASKKCKTNNSLLKYLFTSKCNERESRISRLFIGKNCCVVVCTFIIAQLTTFSAYPLVEVYGLSPGWINHLFLHFVRCDKLYRCYRQNLT